MSAPDETVLDQLRKAARDALLGREFEAAIELSRKALVEAPNDLISLELLGVAYCQSMRPAKGIRYLRKVLTQGGSNGPACINLANALLSLGERREAEQWLEQALRTDPNNADALTLMASIAKQDQAMEKAEALLLRALEAAPSHSAALNALATQYAQLGRPDKSVELFQRAAAAHPDSATLHLNCGRVLQHLGRLEEAEASLTKALQLKPDMLDAHLALTTVLQAAGKHTQALDHARAACGLDSENEHSLYLLCDLLERNHCLDEAMRALKEGLVLHPDSIHLRLVMARCERRTGALDAALNRLNSVPATTDDTTAQAIEAERGVVLDALGDYDQAFDAFRRANRHGTAVWAAVGGDAPPFLDMVRRLQHEFTRDWVDSWADLNAPTLQFQPVFLLSFPRSGTTLLNRMLAAHSELQVLEEIDAINHLARIVEQQLGGYPAGLAKLDDSTAQKLRSTYHKILQDVGGLDSANKCTVDKMPINTVDAALIHRLFPEARIIFVDRDPRDVCLSCFMQPFQPNAVNANFLDLRQTATCYAEVMALWHQYRALFDLNVHSLRYEELTQQPEQTLKSLCTFLGIAWEQEMLNYQARAANVKTASYEQVSRELYTSSSGRSNHYSRHLASLEEVLRRYQLS